MSFVRARQPIVTRVSPHNGNKQYLKPNGGRTKGAPPAIPLHKFEWEFRVNPNGWLTVPGAADIDNGLEISFIFAFSTRSSGQPIVNTNQFTLTQQIISNFQTLRLVVGATTINCTNLALIPGQDVRVRLRFADSVAFVYADDVLVGQGAFAPGIPASAPIYFGNIGITQPATPFQGVIRSISITDANGNDIYQVADGTGTVLLDSGVNPVRGNGSVFANAGLSNWYPGTPGITAWRYVFSATLTVDAIEIDLDHSVSGTYTSAGLSVLVTPANTPVTVNSVTAINNGFTLRIDLENTVITSSDRIQVSFTRSGSTNIPLNTVFYNIPQPADLSEFF